MLTIFEKKQLGIWEEPERGRKRPETEPVPPVAVETSLEWALDTEPKPELQIWYYRGLEFWRELHGLQRANLNI